MEDAGEGTLAACSHQEAYEVEEGGDSQMPQRQKLQNGIPGCSTPCLNPANGGSFTSNLK